MHVFDKMRTDSCRRAFVERMEERINADPEELALLRDYILSPACGEDILRLKHGDFFFDAPQQHFVRRSFSDRRRRVYSFSGRDKYLLQLMSFVLLDFDGLYAPSLCSFRRDNRVRRFFRRVGRVDAGRKHFVMKADIHEYGGSVDQDLLLGMLEPIFRDDPEFLRFLTWILTRNEFYYNGTLMHERVSIIEGLPIGSFLNNIYLDGLDRVLEPAAVIYMRYADDIAFFTDSEERARWALETIRTFCGELRLTLNEEKTRLIPPGESFELLGIEVLPDGFDIGRKSLGKLKRKLWRYRNKLLRRQQRGTSVPEQGLWRMIRFQERLFYGIRRNDHEFNWVTYAFPIITRTDSLKELDHYVQDCIRVAGSGKLGNAKYRIRYDTMRAFGYTSLCHAYYHGYSLEEEPR